MANKYNPLVQETAIVECSQSNDLPFIWTNVDNFTGYTPRTEITNQSGEVLFEMTTGVATNDVLIFTENPMRLEWRLSLASRQSLTIGGKYRFKVEFTKVTFPTTPVAFVGDFEVTA
jgi:hypothetical protein